ncbi:MAG TPA: hypothetical protein VF715_05535 [Thermoleophilaceae bacterium]
MGLFSWEVQLLVAPHRDVTGQHSFLRDLNNRNCVVAERNMVPWTADGASIALIPAGRKSAPVVYEVESQKRHTPRVGRSLTVQAAPAGARILVPRIGGFEILEGGRSVRSLSWEHPERESPFTGWLASGSAWFAVGRRPHGDVTWIWFFGPDGQPLGKERLDPSDIDPIDREAMKAAHSPERSGYSRSLGTQLLRWTDALHDPSRNSLLLAMPRPVSQAFRETDTWSEDEGVFRHVTDRWVSVELRED